MVAPLAEMWHPARPRSSPFVLIADIVPYKKVPEANNGPKENHRAHFAREKGIWSPDESKHENLYKILSCSWLDPLVRAQVRIISLDEVEFVLSPLMLPADDLKLQPNACAEPQLQEICQIRAPKHQQHLQMYEYID